MMNIKESARKSINNLRGLFDWEHNSGILEAHQYAYHYRIFRKADLESDVVISNLFYDYLSGAFNSVGTINLSKGVFREHVIKTYGITEEQFEGAKKWAKMGHVRILGFDLKKIIIKSDIRNRKIRLNKVPFTQDQIEKFRSRLTEHLAGAYNRSFKLWLGVAGFGAIATFLSHNPLTKAISAGVTLAGGVQAGILKNSANKAKQYANKVNIPNH